MATAVAVLASLAFIGWIIFRAVKGKSVKAYMVSYGVAVVAGLFTYAYFLRLDIPQLIKIVVSIMLGIILIVIAALRQRRLANAFHDRIAVFNTVTDRPGRRINKNIVLSNTKVAQ